MTKSKALDMPDKAYKPKPKYSLEVLNEFPDLHKWLEELSRYKKVEDFVYIADYKKEEKSISVQIFTKEHYYTIVAKLPSDKKPEGYFGTYGSCRKPRAGENWWRGNDLPDGEYKRETWERFLNSFIAYELVKVVRNSPNIDERR